MGDENMGEWDDRVGGGMKWENNERDILEDEAIMGLGRNLVLGKHPGIPKDDPS